MRPALWILAFVLAAVPVFAQPGEHAAPAAPAPAAGQSAAPQASPESHAAAPAGEAHGAAAEHGKAEGHGEHGPSEWWKWANFILLAGILGYFIGKHAGPFFAGRSRQIRQDMIEAEEIRRNAEARAAAVDQRLANLGAEIEALRAEAQAEQSAEEARIRQHTVAEIAKAKHRAEQEIEAAGKAARMELKRYSADLAVDLAEQKIRARITPDAQDALVRGFVRDLAQPAPPAKTR